jgi:hypothetical protein
MRRRICDGLLRRTGRLLSILIAVAGIVSCSNPLQEVIEKDIEQKYSAISVYQGAAAIASGSTFHFGSAVKETRKNCPSQSIIRAKGNSSLPGPRR